MKKINFLFVFLLICSYGMSNNDIINSCFINDLLDDTLNTVEIEKNVMSLKKQVSSLKKQNKTLTFQFHSYLRSFEDLKHELEQQEVRIQVLSRKLEDDSLQTNKKIEDKVDSLNDSINSRTSLGVACIMLIIMLLVVDYFILRKKINSSSSSLCKIKAAQESLETAQKVMQEESVKLDSKLVELLDKKITTEELDHSLVLKVADEVTRLEINLSRMDPSIKGYKILCKSIERIKDNLLANGYEIVEMLGKPYVEGMKATPNFIPDDSLKEGEQIITGIIKPQINYKGKMIQPAQITVSQN